MKNAQRLQKLEANLDQRTSAVRPAFDCGVVTEGRIQRIREECERRGLTLESELLRIKTSLEGDVPLENPVSEHLRLKWMARRSNETA